MVIIEGFSLISYEQRYEKTSFLHMRKQRRRSASRSTAKLINAFVFATRIIQSLYFLNLKFQNSSHLVLLYSRVCVGPGPKTRRPVFSQRGSYAPQRKPAFSICENKSPDQLRNDFADVLVFVTYVLSKYKILSP